MHRRDLFWGVATLVAVEPTSLALVHCAKTGDRSALAWQAALAPFARVEFVVSDGAQGIAAGVRAVGQTRAAQAAVAATVATPLVHGLDVFHTAMEAERVLAGYWRRAEGLWETAEQADRAVVDVNRRGRNRQQAAAVAYQAWCKAEKAFAEAERCEHAWQRAHAALQIYRPDGTLNDRGWAGAEIEAALAALPGPDWRKTRGFLRDRRTLAFLDRMHQRLAKAVPDEALRNVCVRRYWLRHQPPASPAMTPSEQVLQVLYGIARDGALSAEEQAAYERVKAVLTTTVRASSAVEGANSVSRMHQCRHRRMTQGLLDLKRLYWNCRKLPTGRRRRHSPYELLGAGLPTTDFWALLQSNPAELQQLLSSKRLRE